jgi:hypothetical protein
MVLEEVNVTAGDIVREIIVTLLDKFTWLVTFVKAVGIVVIVYAIYLLIKIFRDMKMRSRIKKIDDKVKDIDSKLDVLLKANEKKIKIEKLSEEENEGEEKKKKSFWSIFKKKKSDVDIEEKKKKSSKKVKTKKKSD